jgi:hypothetical protein
MSEINLQVGLPDENRAIPSDTEVSGLLLDLYLFFDSSERPISAREFLDFWRSLSWVEKFDYLTLPLH